MYILDTDHLSVLERGGISAQKLMQNLEEVEPTKISASIISYEEQTRGWLDYIKKSKNTEKEVEGYKQLKAHLSRYSSMPIFEFDHSAFLKFKQLRRSYRIGTMDLKIAAIAITNGAVLLTRNSSDFSRISGLSTEDWT